VCGRNFEDAFEWKIDDGREISFWKDSWLSCRHLFFECKLAWLVWSQCFALLGVTYMFHNDPLSKFLQFRMCNASNLGNDVWATIWVGVVSEIWKHKNNVIFKRGVVDESELFALVQLKVWSWISSKTRFASFSYSDWCLVPLVCMRLIS